MSLLRAVFPGTGSTLIFLNAACVNIRHQQSITLVFQFQCLLSLFRKSVKATVILVFLLGFIDLVVFYQPENSPGYDFLVALLDPFQVAIVI